MTSRIKLSVSFVLAFALSSFAWQAADAQMRVTSARVAKSSARNYIKQRVPEKAFEMLQKAIELDADDPEANFMIGTFYADKEMLDEMNEAFDKVLAHKKGNKFFKKGMRLVGASDFLLGGIWYTKETLWTRYYNIGVRALSGQDFEAALGEFDMARKVSPDRPDTYKAMGKVFMQMDSVDVAIEHYQKALSIDSTMVEAHADIGIGLMNNGRYEDAIPSLSKASDLVPENISILQALARAQWLAQDKDGAVQTAEKALEVNPEDPKVLSLVGSIYTDVKDYDKAVESLEKAYEKQPENSDTVFNLANAYLGQGSLEKAEGLFLKSLESDPDDYQAHYQLGSIYDKSKKYDEAIESLQKVVDLKPQFVQGWDALYKAWAHKSAATEGEVAREAAKKAEEALNMMNALGGGE